MGRLKQQAVRIWTGTTGLAVLFLLAQTGNGIAGQASKQHKPSFSAGGKRVPGPKTDTLPEAATQADGSSGTAFSALPSGSGNVGKEDVPPPIADTLPLEELETALPQPEAPPKATQGFVIWRGSTKVKEVALTFDDGPHPLFTPRLLCLLKQMHVRATFFVVGKRLDRCPELAAQMVREGHEVANHTYNHINLGAISVPQVQHEIAMGNNAIRRACGISPKCFRPPGGHHEPNVLTAVDNMKMTTLLWTDDPADYVHPGEATLQLRLISHVRSGAVILLHDGVEQTLNILPDLITRLRREGYRFVTASDMAARVKADPVLAAAARGLEKKRPIIPVHKRRV